MINIPKLPKLPTKEEFSFKEKSALIGILDQIRNTHRFWYIAFVVVIVSALPLVGLVSNLIASRFIARLEPLPLVAVETAPSADLTVVNTGFLPVSTGVFSVYAHLVNPNANWSAWSFDYEFTLRNATGGILAQVSGESFMPPGSSRFMIEPGVFSSGTPSRVEFSVSNIRWTKRLPDLVPEFAILQKRWGDTDGQFFVEGVVKNPYSFLVKKVNVETIIFDQTNRQVLAVNRTAADDLKPFEERYFRMLWPARERTLLPDGFGQIQVQGSVNPLEPGFGFPESEALPSR